jgi:hypothetical protein
MSKKEPKNTSLAKEEMAEEINLDEMRAKIEEEMYAKALSQIKEELKQPTKEKNIMRKEMLDKQMLVPIMNVTNGKLIYQSRKTGSEFQFEKYGDIEYIELYELLTMRSSHRKFLDEPFIIVLDDEVADYLGLTNNYKKLIHATEIDGIFNFPLDHFTDVIKSTPKGLAHLIISKAKEKIQTGELDSVQKIEALEENYNVRLKS